MHFFLGLLPLGFCVYLKLVLIANVGDDVISYYAEVKTQCDFNQCSVLCTVCAMRAITLF